MPLPSKILSRKDEITNDFYRLVDEHLAEIVNGQVAHRFAASHIAAKLFIHPRHLTNTIKLITGKSPCDYMEERLLGIAQKLLTETQLSIADISHKFGYNEPSSFIKFFKGLAGVTPLRYRKSKSANQ